MKPEKFIKQLQERDGVGEIQEQIMTAKVLDFLQLHAKVVEISTPNAPELNVIGERHTGCSQLNRVIDRITKK